MIEIRNDFHLYQVGKQVAETGTYRLYLCRDEAGSQCLLQIALATANNGGLQRTAYVLKELERYADELEEEYARVKKDPEAMLNYKLGFPELVDSFVSQEQGARHINILAFRNVGDVRSMVPLSNITAKDRLRVDEHTSAWIMGKLLKLLVFAFSEGFSIEATGNNVLIEPKLHYVLIFDWSTAQVFPEAVPRETQSLQISKAAQAVVVVLGGELETGTFPDNSTKAYTDFVLHLARGGMRDAEQAHKEFYALVDALWERKYHPFTTKPLRNEEEN